MKKNAVLPIILLIDGENIGHNRAADLDALAQELGIVIRRRVYHRRDDPSTRFWTRKACTGSYGDVLLDGAPEKDKIDRKIQEDARHYMRSPKYGKVGIVTSDGGFRCLAAEGAAAAKLFFIGEKKAPARLRNTGIPFMELS